MMATGSSSNDKKRFPPVQVHYSSSSSSSAIFSFQFVFGLQPSSSTFDQGLGFFSFKNLRGDERDQGFFLLKFSEGMKGIGVLFFFSFKSFRRIEDLRMYSAEIRDSGPKWPNRTEVQAKIFLRFVRFELLGKPNNFSNFGQTEPNFVNTITP